MARFLAWSDLHDEFWNTVPRVPDSCLDVDAVLLAGDQSTLGRHMDVAWDIWQQTKKPVIMVRGNHEYYGSIVPELLKEELQRMKTFIRDGADIRILDGETTVVGDTRIVGATLWTDLGLYPGMARETRDAVYYTMNDFHKIRMTSGRHFEIEDWIDMHWRDREALLQQLEAPFAGKTLVVTHHVPVRDLIHPLREIGDIKRLLPNAGFVSDLWPYIRLCDISAWFCGHCHDNRTAVKQGQHGEIRFLTNSRGYPKEGCEFKPDFVIET